MSKVSDIDRAIAGNKFILAGLKQEIEELSKKLELTESERIKIGRISELVRNSEFLITEYKNDVLRNLGRTPVHATDLEENLIGALMVESGDYAQFNAVSVFLKPEHFYNEINADIYNAILSLNNRNEPFDMSSVVNELRRTGLIDKIGGAFRVAAITSKVSSAASAVFWGRIIVEMAVKRRMTLVGSHLIDGGFAPEKDCFELLDECATEVLNVYSWLKDYGYQGRIEFKSKIKSISLKALKEING